jgi:hypothetical protein
MSDEMRAAHPLLGFRINPRPDTPSVAAIEFQTSKGKFYFAVTKEILEQLAEEFGDTATVTPTIGDFH